MKHTVKTINKALAEQYTFLLKIAKLKRSNANPYDIVHNFYIYMQTVLISADYTVEQGLFRQFKYFLNHKELILIDGKISTKKNLAATLIDNINKSEESDKNDDGDITDELVKTSGQITPTPETFLIFKQNHELLTKAIKRIPPVQEKYIKDWLSESLPEGESENATRKKRHERSRNSLQCELKLNAIDFSVYEEHEAILYMKDRHASRRRHKKCSIEGCNHLQKAQGLCLNHYNAKMRPEWKRRRNERKKSNTISSNA